MHTDSWGNISTVFTFYELDASSTLSVVVNAFVVRSRCSRGTFLSLILYYFLTIPSLWQCMPVSVVFAHLLHTCFGHSTM
jgi:hypothetical protein